MKKKNELLNIITKSYSHYFQMNGNIMKGKLNKYETNQCKL